MTKIFRSIQSFYEARVPLTFPVVTIGNFDGVHLGHREIVRQAREMAKREGGQIVALTFKPHPRIVLRTDAKVDLLTTYDEKIEILKSLGVDFVIEEPFTREFSTRTAQEFFTKTLIDRLGARAIVVGHDFSFGRERGGHLEEMKRFCAEAHVGLTVVPALQMDGETISSSKIRRALLAADFARANSWLGEPFSYQGVVIKGDGRGRTIGFPTANLKWDSKIAIPFGVYACLTLVKGNEYKSVTNIGTRPTFFPEGSISFLSMETHLIGETIDLYGETLKVKFLARLRAEKKFTSVDELKTQIHTDIKQALSMF